MTDEQIEKALTAGTIASAIFTLIVFAFRLFF